MNERRANAPPPAIEATPPLRCGEGAGGEGRANAQPSRNSRATKLGHGWAPAPGENRQKDRTRTRLRARRLRKNMTPAEKELWKLLRSIDGYTFRSQPAIVNRVYDFACYGARLLIELDGAVHDRPDVQADDKEKTLHAVRNGFRVLRFTNAEVFGRSAWVISEVRALLDAPHPPTPSPQGGGGES